MKNYSFGGDLGKMTLDSLEAGTIGMLGMDFYHPKYESDTMAKIGKFDQMGRNVVNGLLPTVAGKVPFRSGGCLPVIWKLQ